MIISFHRKCSRLWDTNLKWREIVQMYASTKRITWRYNCKTRLQTYRSIKEEGSSQSAKSIRRWNFNSKISARQTTWLSWEKVQRLLTRCHSIMMMISICPSFQEKNKLITMSIQAIQAGLISKLNLMWIWIMGQRETCNCHWIKSLILRIVTLQTNYKL